MTPFELMFGIKMRHKNNTKLKDLLEQEFQQSFQENREKLR